MKICTLSGLEQEFCAHCRDDTEIDPYEGLVVVFTMEAKYNGKCVIDEEHSIKEGSTIGKVRIQGEPVYKSLGYACDYCINKLKKKAKKTTNLEDDMRLFIGEPITDGHY